MHPDLRQASPDLDGGRAWAVVAAATLAAAVGLGTVTSHGVLVAALEPGTIAGLGAGAVLVALATTLQFGLGPVLARATARHGIRRVILLAAVAYGGGALLAATTPYLAVGILAYAIGSGVAGACTLAPLMATAAGWFDRRRAAALAIVSTGNALGALVLSPWLAATVQRSGLRHTWLTLAVAGAVALLVCAAVVASPPAIAAAAPPALRLRELVADRPLRRFYLAAVLAAAGVIAVLTYLTSYAQTVGFGPERAAGLLGATAAVGIGGRLLVSVVRPGRAFGFYRASQAILAVSAVAWAAAPARPLLLLVFVGMFGLANGLWAALAPLVVADARPDRLGSLLGVLYTAPAVGGAIGPLVASWVTARAPLAVLAVLLAGCLTAAFRLLIPLTPPEHRLPAG